MRDDRLGPDRVMAACGAKPGSAEDYPFGDGVAVYKVAGKVFALIPLGEQPGSVSLKCHPEFALELGLGEASQEPGAGPRAAQGRGRRVRAAGRPPLNSRDQLACILASSPRPATPEPARQSAVATVQ
jgi:hypothetical protein